MFPVQRHKGLMDIVNVLMAELLLPRQKASSTAPAAHSLLPLQSLARPPATETSKLL